MDEKKESFARLIGRKLVTSVLSQPDPAPPKKFKSTEEVDSALQRVLVSQQRINRKVGGLGEAIQGTIERCAIVRSQFVVRRLEQAMKEKQRLEEQFENLYAGVESHPDVQACKDELQLMQARVDDLQKHKSWLQTKAESLEMSVKSSKKSLKSLKETLHIIVRENVALSARLDKEETRRNLNTQAIRTAAGRAAEHNRGLSHTSQSIKRASMTKNQLYSVRSRMHKIAQSQSESFFRIREMQDFFESCWKSSARYIFRSQQFHSATLKKIPPPSRPQPLLIHHAAVYPGDKPPVASSQSTRLSTAPSFRPLSPSQRLEIVLGTPKFKGVFHNRIVSVTMASDRTAGSTVSTPHYSSGRSPFLS